MSPREYSPDHSIESELEDLDSLLAQTRAHFVFGLSSGAVITLEASRVLPSIHKAALYEPPFYLKGMSHDLVARFNREVGQGRLAAALVTASKIVRLGPAVLNLIPRPLLELATSRVLRSEKKKGTGKMTAYSAMSWPWSSQHALRARLRAAVRYRCTISRQGFFSRSVSAPGIRSSRNGAAERS